MKKKLSLLIIFGLILYFVINYTISNNSFSKLKNYVSNDNKFLIKKFLFPYKYISQLENEIIKNNSRSPISEVFFAVKKELNFKKVLRTLKLKKDL